MAIMTFYRVSVTKIVEGTPDSVYEARPGITEVYAQVVPSEYNGLEVKDLINLVNDKEALKALRGNK
jgi:hypothetical protein